MDKEIYMKTPEYSKLTGGSAREISIKTKYPEFYEYLLQTYPHVETFKEKLYWHFNNLSERPVCKVCGKETTFVNIKEGYREYCSRKCMNSDPNKKEKVKTTCIERYGGVAPACSKEVREKMVSTIAQKSHNTNIEQYGGMSNPSQELKRNQRKTLQELYDVENYIQSGAFCEDVASRHPDVLSVDIINKRFECKCPSPECIGCSRRSYYIPISQYNNRKHMTGTYKCTNTNPIKERTS